MTEYLLGIDIGTSGAKALLLRLDGTIAASQTQPYPLYSPQPSWAEQDPEDWWQATVQSIHGVLQQAGAKGNEIESIGLTGQMHGLVLLDKTGKVLRPCILWNDQRSALQCDQATQKIGLDEVLRLTANRILPGFTAPKLLWVRENEPQVYANIAKVLLPKDYIRYRLTGVFAGDVTDASGTSLFDVRQRSWSEAMLKFLEVPRGWLPEVTESVEISARISTLGARETHLVQGTPVVAGAGDQAAQAVGSGIVREGVLSATVGTSGVVFAASDQFRMQAEGRLHAFCHAVPGMWHLMGVMLSAGGSLRWFRDAFCQAEKEQAAQTGQEVYDLLMAQAEQAPAGSEGLLFLPYLTGERTPYPDPDARGVFFGFSLRHTKSHATRAVIEGVAFGMRDSLELVKCEGIQAEEIILSGGASRSPLWRQILADVFGKPVTMLSSEEGGAYGAALLAGAGAGVYPSVETASQATLKVAGRVEPGQDTAVYEKYYQRYRSLYPALVGEFKAMAKVIGKA